MSTARARLALLPYLVILALGIAVLLFTNLRNIVSTVEAVKTGRAMVVFFQVFFMINLALFIWRLVLYIKYKCVASCTDEELPTLSIIVPAYNEGRQVFDTIKSIIESDYPPEKMSILGIDDGSVDDTWFWLKQAAREFSGRVQIFKQPVNKGKRHALYRGFKQGKGDVFVTIDSDSIVERPTIRNLVSPFVKNPKVGAVAGNVRILNKNEGLIPKMLEVSFAYSFDFLRAGQGVINTVMCTPGALSAYRRDVCMAVLFEWLNQKYFGRPANIGEDRAMTNLIIRSGYYVQYQRDAVVHTNVPVTFTKLWKMLLRWDRSNVRENLALAKFALRKFDHDNAWGLRINTLVCLMNMTLGQAMQLWTVGLLISIPHIMGPRLLMGAAIASCAPGVFYAYRHKSTDAIYAALYSFLWVTCLSWVTTYATVSSHKNGWMTRTINTAKVPVPTPGRKTALGNTARLRRVA